jgi:hypothetical protein
VISFRLFASGAAWRTASRLAAVSALVLHAGPSSAQSLSGRVLLGERPVPNAPIELHRVTQRDRGIVRRITGDAEGRFRLTLPPPADSGFTVYFATAIVHGVRYFGPALHGGEGAGDYRIEVYDTTSARTAVDSVRVLRRDVIVSSAGANGWEVAELVRLRNPTRRTLVPAQERPVVALPLPAGVSAFEAGDGRDSTQSAASDLVPVGDHAWVSAPFVPGDRDFIFRYRLPATPQRVDLPLDRATDSLTVYVRQPAPDARVTGLPEGAPFSAEGETFSRYEGSNLEADAKVALDWRGPRPAPVDPRWAALAVAAAVLAVGGWLAWRRPRAG